MISENRYYITNNTILAASIKAANIGIFLEVDEEKSTPQEIYFILSPLDACAKFAEKFYRGEVQINPVDYANAWKYFMGVSRNWKMGGQK